MGLGKALETHSALTVAHTYQCQKHRSKQSLQDSLRCFDSVRASFHHHNCGVPASAVFLTITDCKDILAFAAYQWIELIVAPPAFKALFCLACCLVDIVSAEDTQSPVH